MEYLFVYGTLMDEFSNSMAILLNENSENLGKGYFYGKLYDLGAYPGAIVSDLNTSKVFGTIYRLFVPEKLLSTLDEYEGVGLNPIGTDEYIRKKITVFTSEHQALQSWVYLYNRSTKGFKLIESGDYLKK